MRRATRARIATAVRRYHRTVAIVMSRWDLSRAEARALYPTVRAIADALGWSPTTVARRAPRAVVLPPPPREVLAPPPPPPAPRVETILQRRFRLPLEAARALAPSVREAAAALGVPAAEAARVLPADVILPPPPEAIVPPPVRETPTWSGDVVAVPREEYWPLFTADTLAPPGALEAAAGRVVEVELLVSMGPLDQVRQQVHVLRVPLPTDPREVWRAVWRAARPVLDEAIEESMTAWGESLAAIELTGIRVVA